MEKHRAFFWGPLLLFLWGCSSPPATGGPLLLGPGIVPWIGWILVLFLAVLVVFLFTGALSTRVKGTLGSDEDGRLGELEKRLEALERAVARLERAFRGVKEGEEE